MAEIAVNNDIKNELQTVHDGIDPVTKKFLPGNKLSTGPKQYSEGILAIRELKNKVLGKISPEIIPVWLDLLHDESAKVRLGAVKLAVETIFPKQIIHNMVGKILHEHDSEGDNKLHGLLSALPQFGEFLKYKQQQDSAQVIDVQPDDSSNTISQNSNTK
jgi:hypothetical protein